MKQKLPSQISSHPRLLLASVLYSLVSFLTLLPFASRAQVELLRDVIREPEFSYNSNRWLTDAGSCMFFVHDNQLWKSNGTTSSTQMLKQFENISALTVVGGTLYFVASTAEQGNELWKSNGTASGTVIVKDIVPGRDGSAPLELTNVNGRLFFVANNRINGKELWVSNGTSSGTYMVKDILRVSGGSNPTSLTSLNGVLYFSANDGSTGYELWRSDGTASGTTIVKDIRPGVKVSSAPQWITAINNTLFFAATDNATGSELWKSDGTETGTVFVKDIFAGSSGSGIENVTDVNGQVFFTANDGIHGDELWKTDGTTAGTVLVEDLNPGKNGSNSADPFLSPMHSFKAIQGILFFVASKGYKDYIYRSDGTTSGTYSLGEAIGLGMNDAHPAFTYYNGYVYFFNVNRYSDGSEWYWLWRMELGGTALTLKRFADNPSYYHHYEQEMISYKGFLYTTGRFHSDEGAGLFQFVRSNGTAGGTIYIKELPGATIGSDPVNMVRVDNLVYIQTKPDLENPRNELYRTDGTQEGTFKVLDLLEETEMVKSGNKLFISTSDHTGGRLFVTSGTQQSTSLLRSGGTSDIARNLIDVNGVLYFTDSNGTLWKTDGSSGGIYVADFQTVQSIANHNGLVYIFAETFDKTSVDLFRNDPDGMRHVKRLRSVYDEAPVYKPTASIGTGFYFVQSDGIHGNELWRSDGTDAGTFMMFDLNTADENYTVQDYDIRSFLVFNNRLHFSAKDTHGAWGWYAASGFHSFSRLGDVPEVVQSVVANETMFLFGRSGDYQHYFQYSVHSSRGHANNTKFLQSVEGVGGRFDYAVIADQVYFASSFGNSIMRTDGTSCGTVEVSTGTQFAYPMEGLGNDLVFGTKTPRTGIEPHVFRSIGSAPGLSTCESSVVAATTQESETVITSYPNPFTSEFSIRVAGPENVVADVAVFNSFGKPVEIMRGLRANADYPNIGQTWEKGIYVIRVTARGGVKNYTVVKD